MEAFLVLTATGDETLDSFLKFVSGRLLDIHTRQAYGFRHQEPRICADSNRRDSQSGQRDRGMHAITYCGLDVVGQSAKLLRSLWPHTRQPRTDSFSQIVLNPVMTEKFDRVSTLKSINQHFE